MMLLLLMMMMMMIRDMFSLPENLGVVAALQRCPTPRLFAGIRLRGLSIVPIC